MGAGPTGLALALKLLQRRDAPRVALVERASQVGGLAASFTCEGIHLDYGSHRLHEVVRAPILRDLQELLGADLLHRPRRGRILIQGRFIGYPLAPLDLLLNLPPSFFLRLGLDVLASPFRRAALDGDGASYAEVLRARLGPTLCEALYFPFARKLWGLPPEEIAVEQARRRVSADSLSKMIRRVVSALPGIREPGAGHGYYYPRQGFGQISNALAEKVRQLGGEILLNTELREIVLAGEQVATLRLGSSKDRADGPLQDLRPDMILATIPITELVAAIRPGVPQAVQKSAASLRYRAIRFCYLILDTDRVTPYDAHYFPQTDLCFSRVSEAKNYSGAVEPRGLTALCAEIPFWPGEEVGELSAEVLAERVLRDLERAGLHIRVPVRHVLAKRYDYAYPSYDLAFAEHLAVVRDYMATIANLIPLGRQADFAHDNLHHALEVAYAAAECLRPDLSWDKALWARHRLTFAEHVVVD
ncbi:MAG: FAD-dependent oxidoreductase [Chloroflexi bacterium]|nr:FAD-dependent oxidoreductase [Chloroflexota bacterium]